MSKKRISWSKGTGNITLTYTGHGDGTVSVSSSDNDLYEERSQRVTLTTTNGAKSAEVTIVQAARAQYDISLATVTAPSQTYSGSAFTPTPTVTLDGETIPDSGYDVTYSDNTNAGTATITVVGKGDYVGTATGTFTISKADPSYTAPTATSLTYNGIEQALLVAGSSSDGTIQYSLNNTDWGTAVPMATNAGTYTSYWRLVGDANHNDVASASISTTMDKITPTFAVPTAKVLTYNTTAQELVNAGATNCGTMKYSLSENGTYTTAVPTGTDYGSYTVWYFVEGDSNINSTPKASVACSISEKKVTATVILSQDSYTYSGSACTPTVTVKDGTHTIPSSEYTVTYSNNVNAGTATVTITDNTAGNYEVTGSATFTIAKADPTYTAPAATAPTYSGSAQNLVGAGSSSHGTFTYSTSQNGTYGSSIPQGTDAGNYSVWWKFTGDANHNDVGATQVSGVKINQAILTVTANAQTINYGGSIATGVGQVTTSGLVSGDALTSITLTASTVNVPGGTITPSAAATTNGVGNYSVTYNAGALTINKISVHTAPVANNTSYTGSAIALLKDGSANGKGTLEYSTNGTSGWTTTVPTQTNAGSYDTWWRFTPTDTTNHNSVGATRITTAIGQIAGSISYGTTSVSKTYGNAAFTNALTKTGDGSVTYASSDTSVATVDSNGQVTIVKAGSCTITATVANGTNYTYATNTASYSLSIAKANLSASVSMSGWTYGGTATNPSVSGNSGSGTVTYTYKVSGADDSTYTTTKPSNAGSYVVRAVIAETTNYNGATVTNTFSIDKAAGSVSISGVSLSYNGSGRSLATVSGATGTMHYSTDYSNWSTSIPSSTNAGSWTIYWYMDASTNYEGIGASTSRYVSSSIAKIDPSITAYPTNANPTYNGSAQYVLTGGTANVAGSFSYSTGTDAGSYTGTWWFTPSDTTNYNSLSGTVSASIAKASQTAPTATGASVSYGNTATATASGGGGQGSIEWSNGNTLSGNVGSKTTKARWSGNGNYNASDWSNEVMLAITKINPTITAPTAKSGLTYTGSSQTLYNAGSNTTAGSFSYTDGTRTDAGSQTVSWSFTPTDTTNYNSMSGSFSASIAKAAPTYTAPTAMTGLTYSGSSQYLTTAGSTSDGQILYSEDGTSWVANRISKTAAGSYTTYWCLYGDSNHTDISSTSISTTIAKASRSSFSVSMSGWTYGGTVTSPSVSGNTESGTVTYQYKVSGGSYSDTKPGSTSTAGTYYVRAVAAATTNYYASAAEASFTIAKANRTLSFQSPTTVVTPSGTVTNAATISAGSSDGTLTYSSNATGVVTVNSSGTVTGVAEGTATITATITGGTNYNDASGSYTIYCFATVHNFGYTGSVQSISLPPGNYKLQCWGAQGGSVSGSYAAAGAKGGYSEGNLAVPSQMSVFVFVGGQGSSASSGTTGGVQNGGWNGGGGAQRICSYNSGGINGISYPRPGGGASDISLVTSDMAYSSYRNNRSSESLNARLIVAGGGGGASAQYTSGTTTSYVSGSATSNYFIGDVTKYELKTMSTSSTQSGAFWHTDGVHSNSSFTIRKYAVTPGNKYYFSTKFSVSVNIYAVAWYNSSGSMVSYENYAGSLSSETTFTDVEVTAPSGAAYLWLNTQNSQGSYALKQYDYTVLGIGPRSNSNFKYYTFTVTAGQTYNVVVPTIENSDAWYNPIAYGKTVSGNIITSGQYYSWNTPRNGFNGSITIPSGMTRLYITVDSNDSAPTVSQSTSYTSSGVSNGEQVGGGTSGGGTNPGTQSGGGGELGKGANMTAANYRYASGGGGGGYYGGGASYDDSTESRINSSGGGSGYVSSELTSASTKAGNTSFPSTGSGNETGHAGDGYVRITRI